MKYIYSILFIFFLNVSIGQIPQVPSHMELGNMKLRIDSKAQEIIQEHVNEIWKSEDYLKRMTEKAHLYFPIIERIFHEEGVPDDFKYLCIQESGFKADAVSSSNAVGYWQFKDFTAREVGLFVERDADERKHIVYASKGAAKYLKKNYFYLKNWVYTCQSYQQGLGGTQRSVDKSLFGAEKMNITKDTYWYVMKFLAHKVAYSHAVSKHHKKESLALTPVLVKSGTRLSDVAIENSSDLEEIEKFNLWLGRTRIPDYREEYYVLIPSSGEFKPRRADYTETITIEMEESDPGEIDRISSRQTANPAVRIILKINDKKAIMANSGDSPVTLALRGGITKDRLIKYNDLSPGEEIVPNMVYYLQPKKNRSTVGRHIVKTGENLWEISQKYGIKEKKIIKKNRLSFGEEPRAGRILFLNKKMPKDAEPEYVNVQIKQSQKPPSQEIEVQLDTSEKIHDVSEAEEPEKDTLIVQESQEENVILISSDTLRDSINIEDSTDSDKSEILSETPGRDVLIHTVSAGETLYSISKNYEVRVEDLVEWNGLKSLSLSIGQKIKILKN